MDAQSTELDFCGTVSLEARMARADCQLAALGTRESTVRAFVCHDVDGGLQQAVDGPLAGALVGVKDIITTEAFPTRYGIDTADEIGSRHDAWCVARVRQLGAAILGKTVCTAFAYPTPGPTTNPHDARRTPGGSSSGSAAAVAAGFVSFALGTQTAGSTIRPASYCGVVGFKPSFGLLPTEGIQPIATTLDHVGVFASSPRDAWYLTIAMMGPRPEIAAARRPRRLLRLRLPPELPQHDSYPQRMDALTATLRHEDITVDECELPWSVAEFRTLQQELCYWEAARILMVPGSVPVVPELLALLGPYRDCDEENYAEARRRRQTYQSQFDALARPYDAVLMPSATGSAPSVTGTGDAVMNRFWTALHVPAINVPFWRNGDGLPLGLQLIGPLGADRALVEVAQWFHTRHDRTQ
jgi:Asp-tRNA(Asn)/Glu-tRNA(Gln) amidotransferase A subunit family amidase